MTYTRGEAPLHPQVVELLQAMDAARPSRVFDAATQRALDDTMTMLFNAGAPTLAVEQEIAIPGPAGDMRALVFSSQEPGGQPRPVVLHMHGGGFVLFKPETTAKISKAMATEGDAVVVSLDYRLAPEHPYPAGLDDTIAAFRWLRANAASLDGDRTRIAVAGDSAGASLAGGLIHRLIDEGETPPEAFVSISGWLDVTMSSPSSRALGPDDPVIDDAVLSFWRDCYAPDASQWPDPRLSPVLGDLSSFPPTCIVAGAIDPFCGEGEQFAEKMRAAARDVELHRYDGMPHWFPMFPHTAPLTDYAERIGAFLKRTLG